MQQAHEFEDEGDAEAANLLRAQAAQAKAKLDGTEEASTALEPYDPMKIRARLLYHYPGLTRHDLKTMDYREYFGFIRELSIILQEKAEAEGGTDKPKKQPQGEINAMLNQFPQPQEYTGEVIQLI